MNNQINYSLTDLAKLKIHFIGVGGAGMSGIARIMLAKGFSISYLLLGYIYYTWHL